MLRETENRGSIRSPNITRAAQVHVSIWSSFALRRLHQSQFAHVPHRRCWGGRTPCAHVVFPQNAHSLDVLRRHLGTANLAAPPASTHRQSSSAAPTSKRPNRGTPTTSARRQTLPSLDACPTTADTPARRLHPRGDGAVASPPHTTAAHCCPDTAAAVTNIWRRPGPSGHPLARLRW